MGTHTPPNLHLVRLSQSVPFEIQRSGSIREKNLAQEDHLHLHWAATYDPALENE